MRDPLQNHPYEPSRRGPTGSVSDSLHRPFKPSFHLPTPSQVSTPLLSDMNALKVYIISNIASRFLQYSVCARNALQLVDSCSIVNDAFSA